MEKRFEISSILDDGRYETTVAATYLGLKPTTLRNARCTGRLAGTTPPAFIKLGRKVLYRGKTLREWREQFSEQGCGDSTNVEL